jgi:GTP-binding protein
MIMVRLRANTSP